MTHNLLHKFDVSCEPVAGGQTCLASEGTPTAAISSKFATYHAIWISNFGSESFATTVPISAMSTPNGGPLNAEGMHVDNGMVNAYDTLQFSSLNNAVLNTLNTPTTYSGIYAQAVQLVAPLDVPVVQFDKLAVTVTVVFNDGSKRTYTFNKANKTFEAVANTAIDSSGNTIPESKPRNGAGFFGDPRHPYNIPNIITILGGAPTAHDGQCSEEVWQSPGDPNGGGKLICINNP